MAFSIDNIIFIGFLLANLIFGLLASRNIKSIKEFAVGDRNFSTATLVATLVATWVSGGTFSLVISTTYSEGFYYLLPVLFSPVSFLIIGYFFAPRVAEFFGKLSVAEVMGSLFGKHVRIITTICGFIAAIGAIAVQFKVSSTILGYFFGIDNVTAVLISSAIVITYSAFGGIKAVTFTDVLQFFCFGAFIPILALTIWSSFDSNATVFETINSAPRFDLHEVFNYQNPKFWPTFVLFFYFAMPGLTPSFFQRILMAKNTKQVQTSFYIAGFFAITMVLFFGWIGILIFSANQDLSSNSIFSYIIDNYSYAGLKGLTIAGIMAMIMSTADSHLNSSAVMFSHDLCAPLGIKWAQKNELLLSRIFSVIIGTFAIIMALAMQDLLEMMIFRASFYMPIVTVPLMLAIMGFRSTTKSVLIGMAAGFITVLIWQIFLRHTGINSVVPGIIANIVFFMGSHYLLKQKGGWVGIKDPAPLISMQQERKRKNKQLINSVKNFNLMKFCQNNLPKNEMIYTLFGFFVIASTYSSLYTIPAEVRTQFEDIYQFIYHSVLIISTMFLTYPIWPYTVRSPRFIALAWNLGLLYLLIGVGSILVFISGFNQLQLMIFMINLLIVGSLLRWQTALLMTLFGVFASMQFFKFYAHIEVLNVNLNDAQFQIIYMLLLFSSALIVFFKPKQQYQELTEEKNVFLETKVDDQKSELAKLHMIKNEFLRNLQHESRTPITGITSLGQGLWDAYDQLSEEQRRKTVHQIAQSSERLISLVNNLVDISQLESLNYKLSKKEVDLSAIVYQRLELCQKLYIDDKNRDKLSFDVSIEEGVTALCDEYYIARTIDNIIINAIQYGKKGNIETSLKSEDSKIIFSVKDEGIGIPKEELYDIFNPFTTSSKTKTPAGGRGIGLTLCQKVVDAHNGRIWAESDGTTGSIFKFTLPK